MARQAVRVFALLWLASCLALGTERPVMVLMAPTRHDIAPGETVTLKVFVRNNLTATPPLTLSATARFIDDDGNEQVSTAFLDLPVSHSVHVSRIRLGIPDPLAYVPNTAAADGQPLAATPDGQSLNVLLDADVPEQQTVLITLDVCRPAL
jgi:hypothetical protein